MIRIEKKCFKEKELISTYAQLFFKVSEFTYLSVFSLKPSLSLRIITIVFNLKNFCLFIILLFLLSYYSYLISNQLKQQWIILNVRKFVKMRQKISKIIFQCELEGCFKKRWSFLRTFYWLFTLLLIVPT